MGGLYPVGSTYLSFQTQIDSGGVFAVVLNNMDFVNGQLNSSKIQNMTMWLSYIKEFLFSNTRLKPILQNHTYQLSNWTSVSNPNYGITIMMIFWLLTFLYLLYNLIMSTLLQYLMDKKDKKGFDELKFRNSRNKKTPLSRRKYQKKIVVFSILSIVTLWTIFMVLLCISQYLIVSKFSSTMVNNDSTTSTTTNSNSTTSYSSIRDSISASFKYLNNFIDIITKQTNVFLASSLSSIAVNTRTQMRTSIAAFGSQVLVTFNITSLFNTALKLINGLNDVVNSMTYINNNCQNTLKDIDNTKGAVSVYQSNIANYLDKICNSLTDPNLQTTCRVLQAKNGFFQVGIQTTSVSSSSSVIMLFVLKQFNINVTNIATTFNQVDSDFQARLSALYNSTVNQLDIASQLAFVTSTWNSLVKSINPTISTLTTYNATIDSYMDYVVKYESIVIIILIILLFSVVLILLLVSFRDSLQEKTLRNCLNFFVQCLFIAIIFLSSLICIIILITVNFSQSEICNQVNTTTGVNLLDQMLNIKLASPWNSIMQSMASSASSITITLSQPTYVLTGIKDRCRNTSTGLLSILGMGNVVNITQIVRSPSVMSLIAKAQNDSLNSFLEVNPQQIIPSNLTAFFAQTSTLIVYFDAIDYSAGIQELQKPLVGIVDYVGFFYGLSNFTASASKVIGWTSDLKYLNDTITNLIGMITSLNTTQTNTNTLANNFQVLQNNRNNTKLLNQLMSTITDVQNLFNNTNLLTSLFSAIYNDMIATKLMNTIEQIIGTGINKLTSQMLPCNDLANIFEAFSTTLCSNSNLIVSMATFGIILLLVIVFGQIMTIIVIVSISLRLSVEKNVSHC